MYKKRTVIFSAISILWCVIIFMFSAQDGTDSTKISGGFINFMCELIVPEFDFFNGLERAEFIESMQFTIRKLAHFTVYMILGIFSYQAFCFASKRSKRIAYSLAFCALYACSDELHQGFIPGRSPKIPDVLIDTSGALTGILFSIFFYFLFTLIFKKMKNKT